jgi:uncharacterized protein YbjT (DUF2867 family)
MSIVITGATGTVGSAVTRAVLDAGEEPLLVLRSPEKAQEHVARGARVAQGSHADADFLVEATRGATALFVLTPNNLQLDDVHAHYRSFAEAAATAIRANAIPHVVHLSSLGAELKEGTGPVAGLHLAEQILNEAGAAHLVHLRPAYFMENTLMQIPSLLQAGCLFTSFPEGATFPMVAAADIGARAAKLLCERRGRGTEVVELLGPTELSHEDLAKILSATLGRSVTHVTVSEEQTIEAMRGMGFSAPLAEAMAELSRALSTGLMHPLQPRDAQNTTPTRFATFAEEVFKPAFEAAVRASAPA